jgi:hypothetical protein
LLAWPPNLLGSNTAIQLIFEAVDKIFATVKAAGAGRFADGVVLLFVRDCEKFGIVSVAPNGACDEGSEGENPETLAVNFSWRIRPFLANIFAEF